MKTVKFQTEINPYTIRKMRGTAYKKLIYALAAVGATFVLLGILALVFAIDDDATLGIALIVSGIVVPATTLILLWFKQRKLDKTSAYIREGTLQIFTFDNKGFTIETVTDSCNSEAINKSISQSSYEVIYRVIEKKEYYALYISSGQYYVLFKGDMIEGNREMLNDMLKEYIGGKFKETVRK